MEPTAKTLAIFGATGRAGQHLVQQALERGYCVRALARDPGKLALQNERLLVIQGSLSDTARVEQVVAGADAVLSALGPTSNEPTFEISQMCIRDRFRYHDGRPERIVVNVADHLIVRHQYDFELLGED